jgi:hypothetical protein
MKLRWEVGDGKQYFFHATKNYCCYMLKNSNGDTVACVYRVGYTNYVNPVLIKAKEGDYVARTGFKCGGNNNPDEIKKEVKCASFEIAKVTAELLL